MTVTNMESLSFLNHQISSKLTQDEKDSRSVYLKFYIDPETPALLSMNSIQEAAIIASNLLTTIPNMAPYILGLTNRRSRVMWVVDLSHMVGLSKLSFIPQKIDAIIIKIGTFISALAIHKIEGTVRISPEEISAAPTHISPALVPYLKGCVLKEKKAFLVLDSEAIAQSPLLHQV